MLYPPKKRGYSPEQKKTKELSNLMNINPKFTGSGGSSLANNLDSSSLAPKKHQSVPKPSASGIFQTDKYFFCHAGTSEKPRSLKNITKEEICQWQWISKVPSEK